jgi:Xaa-Pro aminopeptidase
LRHNFSLKTNEIEENLQNFSAYLKKNSIEAAYISSFDIFMNEYVPMQECHRYYLTGFTGSVAEALVLSSGKCFVFVDGRYHEQADIEVKANGVVPVKCPFGVDLFSALVTKVKEEGIESLWINGDRSSLNSFEELSKVVKNITCESDKELESCISLTPFDRAAKLEKVEGLISSSNKVKTFLNEGEAFWLTALDSISWATNFRGYGLPFQSSFMARALVKTDGINLAVPSNYEVDLKDEFITINKCNLKTFSTDIDLSGISKVLFDPKLINVTDFLNLENKIGKDNLVAKTLGITSIHARKTDDEMKQVDESFKKGDKAIVNTIRWANESFNNGVEFSELDVFHKTTEFYEEQGSREQSFGTISGLGANSSIIHYSSPSADVKAEDGMILLLDSGGFFDGGFATDTTRTIFLGKGEASEKQKTIYTLVLKGLLQAQNAVFPKGTWGSQIDALARTPILRGGYNYAHGTGHGVGINVHEGGLRFSPTSSIPLDKGNVGSIEPGIYLPGFGGVRLENIVSVVEHPEYEDMLCFRPLVYIGFDHKLIEFDLLEDIEKKWLSDYELECQKRGTLYP